MHTQDILTLSFHSPNVSIVQINYHKNSCPKQDSNLDRLDHTLKIVCSLDRSATTAGTTKICLHFNILTF